MSREESLGLSSRRETDPVNPPYYRRGEIELIDIIEAWELNFHLGNALTYIVRSEHKENKVRDLRKAIWYINREIGRIENEQGKV